ncbi:hypothetical protein, partial [Klebsiella pneumoniae]|uniref:hypothetical protein n=1 Tax=Klebsiella pneumoniae TaxID=573 RepID=UPI003CF71F02
AHRAIAFARGFDLVITGLTGTSARKSHSLRAFPEHLILEGGRPVLFQPCEGGGSTSFDHIVVLWNGSREAARAIHDAMPLLQR